MTSKQPKLDVFKAHRDKFAEALLLYAGVLGSAFWFSVLRERVDNFMAAHGYYVNRSWWGRYAKGSLVANGYHKTGQRRPSPLASRRGGEESLWEKIK